MRRILFFMLVSANGLYEREPWGLDWHNVDAEFGAFANDQLDSVDTLLFGRKTYEGMAAYWPTAEAIQQDRETATRMNAIEKVVFSKTLDRAEWNNTRIARGELGDEIEKVRRAKVRDALVMGSSDLAASLSAIGGIDEYRILVNPVVLREGRMLLSGLKGDLRLRLVDARTFRNGNVLLRYEPAKEAG